MRKIHEIARDVRDDWTKVNFAAEPYLGAMHCLEKLDDYYGADSARNIVLYFLCNASTWRGDVAKRIKAELKAMLKEAK